MTEIYKKELSETLYNMVSNLINLQEPCKVLVQNHNNWNIELPDNLKNHNQFILDISAQTLEDSYVENDIIVINTVFSGVEYSKEFEPADFSAIISEDGKSALVVKPFIEEPSIPESKFPKTTEDFEVDEKARLHSMNMFKKHNPDMF